MEELVQAILERLVFDSELFVLEDYHAKIMEEYLEFFSYGLSILLKEGDGIFWLEENESEKSFVIMPSLVEDILSKEVFSKPIPFVFSSATLSEAGDFTHFAQSLGIKDFLSFSVGSPFDYSEKMTLMGHLENDEYQKWQQIGSELNQEGGQSLILFSSTEEMTRFRHWADTQKWTFEMYYEGDREISETVKAFQQNTTSVLCAYHLWEGLDVPGEALTNVLIASLPFPPQDPVFKAKRKRVENPIEEIDKAVYVTSSASRYGAINPQSRRPREPAYLADTRHKRTLFTRILVRFYQQTWFGRECFGEVANRPQASA